MIVGWDKILSINFNRVKESIIVVGLSLSSKFDGISELDQDTMVDEDPNGTSEFRE